MKILLLSPLPPPAGGIASWTNIYINSKQVKKNNIDIIDTSIVGDRVTNLGKRNIIDEIYRAKNIFNEMKLNFKGKKYNIVHINTSCSKFGMIRDYLCAKKAINNKAKLIIHCHCDTNFMVQGKMVTYLFKKILKIADKIFCLNSSSYNHIKGLSNIESTIVPNFCEKNIISNLEEVKISESINNILYVGHVTKSKGCDDIITVASRMPNIRFIMVGYLSGEIKQMHIPNNVVFLGEISREEVIEQMINSDILLFPTHTEGFPNVILEAMSCGLPIITTSVGAIPDMIEDKGGILVDVGDVNGIINAINILQDKDLRRKMSEWNIEKVKRSYTIDIVMDKIFQEYRSLM